MSNQGQINEDDGVSVGADSRSNRRTFLKWGGASLAALALTTSANAGTVFANPKTKKRQIQAVISLGTGDTAIANLAFLLEQLEADFYSRVIANFYTGATAEERQILTDIRSHEVIHREYIRAAIGSNGIPQQTFDFSRVDFTSRDSVLGNAQAQEDTGVAAINGSGQAIEDPNVLAALGKIVSVEARHAATIRDLRIPRNGYSIPHPADFALDPLEVLTLVSPYLPVGTVVDASGLPRIIAV